MNFNRLNSARNRLGLLALGAVAFSGACTAPAGVTAGSELNPIPSVANVLSDAQLARLAQCESSGNPTVVSKNGKYHGLYQFDQRTWDGVAKRYLPAYVGVKPSKAPKVIQDAMARALYSERGRSPWPVCGKRL